MTEIESKEVQAFKALVQRSVPVLDLHDTPYFAFGPQARLSFEELRILLQKITGRPLSESGIAEEIAHNLRRDEDNRVGLIEWIIFLAMVISFFFFIIYFFFIVSSFFSTFRFFSFFALLRFPLLPISLFFFLFFPFFFFFFFLSLLFPSLSFFLSFSFSLFFFLIKLQTDFARYLNGTLSTYLWNDEY